MKTKLIILILAFSSWAAFAQHHHAAHDNQRSNQSSVVFKDANLDAVYNHYLHIKDALVASNSDEVSKAAADLIKSLHDIKGANASHEAAIKLAKATNLEKQRELFSTVSNEMTTLVKGDKLTSGALYLEYCPMANNNTGAYWLSNEKEIKNPYFGNKMLKCGSVKETIE